ncbi:hypothetical protein Tco_1090911 [Tanacetum coccineum]|uniref:Uncharacterized protein n=1 Tax=Tanacetum coccineum TaxID=301880 RepID=A0ABQ5I7N3_9ASTR
MALGKKAFEAQDKSTFVTIAEKKVTLLMSVRSLRRTRLLSEELGVIVKTAVKRKRTQHVSWKSTLKRYGKIWYDEDVHDLRFVETEFPAIVFNNNLTSNETHFCEPMVSSLNDELDFRISFEEFDDDDYTVNFDKKSFSYKIISVNDLKTDSENLNDKVNMPSFPSPEPTFSYFDDLDYFKDFEKEFPAIVYNDAQTFKLDFLTEPTLSPQHIDEFNLKDKTSLSECDEEEQNVIYFNDLFPFNVIYLDDLKSDKDNDDDKIDVEYSSWDLSVKPLLMYLYTDDGAYAHWSNQTLETIGNLHIISSQNSCDFTTVTINGETEERRTIEGIIRNYYDREDGETTPRFEV